MAEPLLITVKTFNSEKKRIKIDPKPLLDELENNSDHKRKQEFSKLKSYNNRYILQEITNDDIKPKHEYENVNRIHQPEVKTRVDYLESKPQSPPIQIEIIEKNNQKYTSNHKYIDFFELVPNWSICCGIIAACFLVAIVIAVVLGLIFIKSPLYNESCVILPCYSEFNLVCLNGTCSCDSNQYHDVRCFNKSSYGNSCSSSIQCKDDLICDNMTNLCNCSSQNIWDGVKCVVNVVHPVNATINEMCIATYDCVAIQNLTCINSICSCTSAQYWDSVNRTCVPSIPENNTCLTSSQCYTPMSCSSIGICQCSTFQYHDINSLTCVNQKLISGTCNIDYYCRVDLGLQCVSGACQCSGTNIWFPLLSKCNSRLNYGQIGCSSASECTTGLVCSDGVSDLCDCPLSSQSGMCDCARTLGNEFYWDGTACVPALTNGSSCTNSSTIYMCQVLTQGTECSMTGASYYCQCSQFKYFDATSNKCLNQVFYGHSCTSTAACRTDQNLACVLSTCDCIKTSGQETYWNGTFCALSRTYNSACNSDVECQTLTQGTLCSAGRCICNGTSVFSASWNKCVVCESGWQFIEPYCYKSGSVLYPSSVTATGADVDNGCDKSLLPLSLQPSLKLAEMNNSDVRNYFISMSISDMLWVDLHKSTTILYVSSSANWRLNTSDQSWCPTATLTKDCVYYSVLNDCFDDESCSVSKANACQYTPL